MPLPSPGRRRAVGALTLAAALSAVTTATADQVIPDDLIVQGSLCTGPLCADGEAFGFDTVRLKGESLRLRFHDTSASANFPTNDWEFTLNDDTSGFFAFTDVDAGTSPLRILAGAPTDTLRVDPDGSVRLLHGPLATRVDATSTENLSGVDADAMLAALRSLPISRYEFVADPADAKHVGPSAADFNAAFGLGSGSSELAPADVAGVALVAAKRLSAQVSDLTGPQGPRGERGAAGPKGDTGPAGADASPSVSLKAGLERLDELDRAHRSLRKRNVTLLRKVRSLQKRVDSLRKAR